MRTKQIYKDEDVERQGSASVEGAIIKAKKSLLESYSFFTRLLLYVVTLVPMVDGTRFLS